VVECGLLVQLSIPAKDVPLQLTTFVRSEQARSAEASTRYEPDAEEAVSTFLQFLNEKKGS
jgi:hypothetical protein